MSYTKAQLKTDIVGMLHGTSLNKVRGIDELIDRSARDLLLEVDFFETIRIAPLANALYDKVYDYAAPSDMKGNCAIDIRPQVNRTPSDVLAQRFNREFDANKTNHTFSVLSNTGVKTLRISKNTVAGVLLNGADNITDNGTWAVGGNASGLVQDTINFAAGSGSLRFDISALGSSYIENSTMTAVDLTNYINVGSGFVYVYMPTASQVTNVILRWGSSSANYYTQTVTTGHFSPFVNGWNLLRFDWSTATETGTVVDTAIDYARVTFTTTAAGNNYRVDNIIFNLPSIWEIEYYSKFLFSTAAGVWTENSANDSDNINLDTESYNILLLKCVKNALQQQQDQGNTNDSNNIKEDYEKAVKKYQAKYPSQITKTVSTYYRMYKPPRSGSWI